MKEKGFTLAEILGVIVIIGLILLLVGPAIVNRIRASREKVGKTTEELVYYAAGQHISENKQEYPNGGKYCIKIEDLIKENKLVEPVIDTANKKDISSYTVGIKIYNNGYAEYNTYKDNEECEAYRKLPFIQIYVENEGTLENQKIVTIAYPKVGEGTEYPKAGSDYKYTYPKNNEVSVNITNDEDLVKKITVTESGEVTASMLYGDERITERKTIQVAKTYEITLDNEGATKEGTKTIYQRYSVGWYDKYDGNTKIKAITKPEKTGYTFAGYYTKQNGEGTQVIKADGTFVSASPKTFTANGTLYAHWTAKVAKVTLDNQGATTAGTATVYQKYNTGWYKESGATTKMTSITKPEKTGYTFAGYYTKQNGEGTQVIKADGTFVSASPKTFTANGTLYAHWTAKVAKVTLDNQGATTEGTKTVYQKYNAGWYKEAAATTKMTSITKPAKAGYSFGGYYTKQNGEGTQVIKADGTFVSASPKTFTANGTLYAKWTACGKGKYLNGNTCTACAKGTYSTGSANASCTSCPSGYTTDGTGASAKSSCKISCAANYRVNTADGKCTTACPSGYIHAAHTVTAGSTSSACSAKTIKVTFMRNSTSTDTTSATQTFTYGKSGQTFSAKGWTKAGYSLIGWNRTRSATTAEYSVLSSVADSWINSNSPSITIYGIWTACGKGKYLNGNTCTACAKGTYSTGSANASCTSCPSGYTTDGTGASAKSSCKISCAANHRVNTADGKCTTACPSGYSHAAHTVTAGSTSSACSANTYKVAFNGNGSTSGSTATKTCTYNTDCTLTSNGFSRTGYSFSGWNTKADGSGTNYANGAKVKTLATSGTVTLYAKWTACGKGKYLNGNTCTACAKGTYSTGSANASCTSCPSGYTTDGTGASAKSSCKISCAANYRVNTADGKCTTACPSGYIHAAHTVTAGSTSSACSAKTIKVTFMRNSTSTDTTSATQTFTYGKTGQTFSAKGWSKAGYTLKGWNRTKSATTTEYGVLSPVADSWINSYSPSITIYGIWKDETKPAKPTITNPCNTVANGKVNCHNSGTVTARSSDAGSGITKWKYYWGDGVWREMTGSASATFYDGSAGTEKWGVRACDAAGNCSDVATYTTYVSKYSDCASRGSTCVKWGSYKCTSYGTCGGTPYVCQKWVCVGGLDEIGCGHALQGNQCCGNVNSTCYTGTYSCCTSGYYSCAEYNCVGGWIIP